MHKEVTILGLPLESLLFTKLSIMYIIVEQLVNTTSSENPEAGPFLNIDCAGIPWN